MEKPEEEEGLVTDTQTDQLAPSCPPVEPSKPITSIFLAEEETKQKGEPLAPPSAATTTFSSRRLGPEPQTTITPLSLSEPTTKENTEAPVSSSSSFTSEDPELCEVDCLQSITLDELTLHKPEEIYYELYRKTKQKAKEALLEAKRIKEQYQLDVSDWEESDVEEEDDDDSKDAAR